MRITTTHWAKYIPAQQGEDLSVHTNDGRIAALQQGQQLLEERMSAQFQQIQSLLLTLTSNQPKPEVSFHPNIDTTETPAKFNRRSSTDTRTSLNEARNFTQSATKLPRTAPGSEGNQQSDTKADIDRGNAYPSMTIQHPEQFQLQTPIAKITLQHIRNL